jgi:lipid A 3-O-deacylase
LFSGVDQHYTNCIRVYWLFPKGDTIKPLQVVREFFEQIAQDENKLIRFSLSMGQEMYTPEDRYITILISNDRPYADWLYGGMSLHRVTDLVVAGRIKKR